MSIYISHLLLFIFENTLVDTKTQHQLNSFYKAHVIKKLETLLSKVVENPKGIISLI